MKKECAHTRKALRKYLHGHLFTPEQIRIERHLRACVVCYSEYQALKRVDETRRYLKDITPPEGVVQRVKAGVSGLAKLKKLLYRPLWVAAIIGAVALAYIYVIAPRHRDLEIENLEKSLPAAAPSVSGSSQPTTTATAAASPAQPAPVQQPIAPQPAPRPALTAAAVDPLSITITPDDEAAAIRRLNEVMRGHGSLRKLKFSDTVREISGSLTAKELLTFFNRIEPVGKVSYSRKRFESFPSTRPISFVLKLKSAPPRPKAAALPASPAPAAEQKPAEAAAPPKPASAPTPSAQP